MSKKHYLGIDCGSVSLKLAVLDGDKRILWRIYRRTHGAPLTVLAELLDQLQRMPNLAEVRTFQGVYATGSGRFLVSECLGSLAVNEITAHGTAAAHFHPEANGVIEIGGQDAKLILLEKLPGGETVISDSQMNDICAAGTGSFLDQQAFRLGVTPEELAWLAVQSTVPAKVSGRCSVFAKTDLIHLQQSGVPKEDLAAGLCQAVAKNYVESLVKGRMLKAPLLFQGGVAQNEGVRRAILEVLGLEDTDLIRPAHFDVMGAIGACLYGLKRGEGGAHGAALEELRLRLGRAASQEPPSTGLAPLGLAPIDLVPAPGLPSSETALGDVWIGVDVGSISAKLAVVDRDGRLRYKDYRATEGKPLETVQACIETFRKSQSGPLRICGVGVTGSGRDFLSHYLNADLVRNEITAQAQGTIALVPEVGTIIEIGGQDSKYIRIENGAVVDFVMNKTCAAGTGSFLAEQAGRLQIPLESFSGMAMRSHRPLDLGTRCTVFMETDCIHYQQAGAPKEDLLAGLSYSIARNYLEKVVANRPLVGRIVVQGGIAYNQSVVAAFAHLLGQPVAVAPHHEVTGALGMALLALREMGASTGSHFAGLDLADRVARKTLSQCGGCSNSCSLVHMEYRGGQSFTYGDTCGKFEGSRKGDPLDFEDYFESRRKLLMAFHRKGSSGHRSIGIPRALLFHELFPMWAGFFQALGHRVVLSKPLSKDLHEKGIAKVLVDTCFPIRSLNGAVMDLHERGVDAVFLPSVLDLGNEECGSRFAHNCQYIQQIPDLIRASMDIPILTHTVRFRDGASQVEAAFLELGKQLGATPGEVRRAYEVACGNQMAFRQSCEDLGHQALTALERFPKAMVLVGHPYILHDPFFNLNLARRLAKAGIPAIPGDLLPLDPKPGARPLDLAWKSNNRSMDTLEFITRYNQRGGNRLLPVLLTQFGCAADSMLTPYVASLMGDHPWLELEVDEHNSATGMMTRCEAFWESVDAPMCAGADFHRAPELSEPSLTLKDVKAQGRTIHMLPFCEAAYVIPEVLRRHGVPCEMLPKTTPHSNQLGRKHANEKHCRTYQVVLGDFLAAVERPGFDSSRAAFFMFDYEEACRLSLFRPLFEKVMKEHGASDVRMVGTLVDDPLAWIRAFGPGVATELWEAMIAADYLSRFRYERRPYEQAAGAVDQAYEEALGVLHHGIQQRRILSSFRKAMDHLKAVPILPRDLVRVGVVGDAFTRVHEYGMAEIFQTIEEMGGVVVLPPSWHDFINYGSRRRAQDQLRRRRVLRSLATRVGSVTLDRFRRRIQRVAESYSEMFVEPGNEGLTRLAASYVNVKVAPVIPSMFIGKTVDFVEAKGVHGLVNAYGFNCCLGKIATACVHRLRRENHDVPMLTFIDDGLQQTNIRTRVEAFMEQAWAFKRKADALERVGSE